MRTLLVTALFCALAFTSVVQSTDPLPTGARFCLFVRHTDADREWACDNTALAKFEKGLEEAKAKDWTVVDMKQDWKVVFPFEKK